MSVMQFKEVALIGTDGNYLKFSPITEGVDGATRSLFVTEVNEPILLEDDQTVFTSVKNTITIISPVLDSQISILESWVANDVLVGFSGYTVGGVGYACAVTSDDATPSFQLELRSNATDNGTIIGSRGDAFMLSSVVRVSGIKNTYKIVLTQICVQGKNATNGIKYGLVPSTNLYETSVDEVFSSMASSVTLPCYGRNKVNAGASPVYASTASAFSISLSGASTGEYRSLLFFPFNGVPVRINVNGTQSAGFNTSANAIMAFAVNASGSDVSSISVANATTYTDATAGFTLPAGTVYLRTEVNWQSTGAATASFTGLTLRPNV